MFTDPFVFTVTSLFSSPVNPCQVHDCSLPCSGGHSRWAAAKQGRCAFSYEFEGLCIVWWWNVFVWNWVYSHFHVISTISWGHTNLQTNQYVKIDETTSIAKGNNKSHQTHFSIGPIHTHIYICLCYKIFNTPKIQNATFKIYVFTYKLTRHKHTHIYIYITSGLLHVPLNVLCFHMLCQKQSNLWCQGFTSSGFFSIYHFWASWKV